MSNDEILEYGFKNYENFNYEEDKEIAEKFVEIFVNNELYKKNRDYKQLKAFIYIYGNLRMREMGVITNIVTVDPGTSKRKYKITRFFDRQGYDKYLNGSCNEERIKVQLTNYLIRSLQMSDKANFARLINTINHELKHARCYKDTDFYNNIMTKQNYDNLKFNLFDRATDCPYFAKLYNDYYLYYEEEIGAFKYGYESAMKYFDGNRKFEGEMITYEMMRNKYVQKRFTETYDYVNYDLLNSILSYDQVRELDYYKENKHMFDLEFDDNGNQRPLKEIIDNKYKQLDLLNNMILENPSDENLINILMNHEIEKTFNDIAYNKIIRGENTQGIEDIELLEILKYGHNKETLRLLDSDFYSLIFLKRDNKSYIEKRLQKIEELQGELMGVKSCKQKKF